MELNLSNTKLPVRLTQGSSIRFGKRFIIRCVCHVNDTGSHHAIFAKRPEIGTGERPGVVLRIAGTRVELLTFGLKDLGWHCLSTEPNVITAGERVEICALRDGSNGEIYIDGLPKLKRFVYADFIPGFIWGASCGDVNNDSSAYVGIHIYKNRKKMAQKHDLFRGGIEYLGIFNKGDIELPRGLLSYPKRHTMIPLTTIWDMWEEYQKTQVRSILV